MVGGSGIGRATVERFVNDGAKVAIFDINTDIVKFGDEYEENIKVFQTDCGSKASCENSVELAFNEFGNINHMVYSVAYFGSKALDASESDWMKSLEVNVAGKNLNSPFLKN